MKRAVSLAAVVIAAATIGLAAPAGAASHRVPFSQAQKQVEAALAARLTQLSNLTAEVKAATNLAPSVRATLNTSLTGETGNITALATKVPLDTTFKELNADRYSMIHGNRVYAVMTPQVRDSIEAANDSEVAADLQSQETALGSGIQARKGNRGWRVAWAEFERMTTQVADAGVTLNFVTPLVLAQTPQGFPGNEHAFVQADRDLLNGEILTARASFNRNVIELFIDGYAATD
jgi:hypothetical protein